MSADIIEACKSAPGPILVAAHPASGTKWLQSQLEEALGGPVAHEALYGREIANYKAVITFKHWLPAVQRKYNTRFIMTRDPLKVIASSIKLFELSQMRGTILAQMFGDGMPLGTSWATMQQQPATRLPISTLIRWYELAEGMHLPPACWFKVEDAVEVRPNVDPNSKASGLTVNYNAIAEIDGNAAKKLAQLARRHGYEANLGYGGTV